MIPPKRAGPASLLPAMLRRRVEHRPGLMRIVDNFAWLLLDNVLRLGVGLVVGVWLARYLGAELFGQFNYAIAFVGLFGAVAGLGLGSIVVRDMVRDPTLADRTLGTAFVLQLLGGVLAAVLAIAAIAQLRPDDEFTRFMVAVLGVALMFKASEVVKYWFESQVQSRYAVWAENGAFVTMAAMKVGLIIHGASLSAFVWLSLAEAALTAAALLAIYAAQGGSLRAWQLRLERAKTLLADSWPLVLSSIAIVIYMRIDQVMIGEMAGAEAVGKYSAAARLAEAWYFIPMAIVSSVFPSILHAKASGETMYLDRLQRLYNLLALMTISAALATTLLADWLVALLFGDAFAGAGPLLAVQVWAGVFVAMGVARGKWLLAENLQHIGYWYIGLAMVVNVAGNLLLIPDFGALGAAVATVISQATAALLAPAIFPQTRASAVMLLRSLNPTGWYQLLCPPRRDRIDD
jgi:O-antigen/teichoic acid export membrane protein